MSGERQMLPRSAPMASISSMGNVAPNWMNLNQAANISNVISQQLRSGKITPQQAALMASKLKSLGAPSIYSIAVVSQSQVGSPSTMEITQLTGMSAPMAPISSMGNVAPNSMNLNQAANISNVISKQLRSGKITPQHA